MALYSSARLVAAFAIDNQGPAPVLVAGGFGAVLLGSPAPGVFNVRVPHGIVPPYIAPIFFCVSPTPNPCSARIIIDGAFGPPPSDGFQVAAVGPDGITPEPLVSLILCQAFRIPPTL